MFINCNKLDKKFSGMPALAGKFKKFEVGGKAYVGYTYTVTKNIERKI
jgi:hypothetical protein